MSCYNRGNVKDFHISNTLMDATIERHIFMEDSCNKGNGVGVTGPTGSNGISSNTGATGYTGYITSSKSFCFRSIK